MKRFIFLLFLAAGVTVAQAPERAQLEAFAGSRANLENLRYGLQAGAPVTLSSITAYGMRETVIFTAAQPLTEHETASVLDTARGRLLERGIDTPSGWDIALVLMGRQDISPAGPVRVPGLLAPADPEKPMLLSLRMFAGSTANYKSLMRGLTHAWPITLRGQEEPRTRLRFTPRIEPLSEHEARHVLLEASDLLSALGIYDPTPEELRASLMGGVITLPSGGKASIVGVLGPDQLNRN